MKADMRQKIKHFYTKTEVGKKLRFKSYSCKQKVMQLNRKLGPSGGFTTAVLANTYLSKVRNLQEVEPKCFPTSYMGSRRVGI